jgi:NRPS condensation-like uncharacterized protein
VSQAKDRAVMDRVAAVLTDVRRKGVRLWCKNGHLHYKAPKGALTQGDIEELRISKGQIVALLEKASGMVFVEPTHNAGLRLRRAPLTFSQLMYWNWYRLSERRSRRDVASAVRLCGRLNVQALEKSVAELVRRHDALRTRIVVLDGVPVQEVSDSVGQELEVSDLVSISRNDCEQEVQRLIEEQILEPIDISAHSLFEARLLRLHEEEHVLVVTMEHIISDAFSLNIVLREIFGAYKKIVEGRALCLPPVSFQFTDYAVWQKNSLKIWLETHGAYWSERLACQRVRFPGDKMPTSSNRRGHQVASFRISTQMKAQLREWCRARRTTLVMGVLTAYVALVLRWCTASEIVIRYQSDGRITPEMRSTIGYFAFALFIRVELRENDSFTDLMDRVAKEFCDAQEHGDPSYLAARMPRAECTLNSLFNWIPGEEIVDNLGLEKEILCFPVDFGHPTASTFDADEEPFVVLRDKDDGGTACEMWFPTNRFSEKAIGDFGRNFLMFIREMMGNPEGRVRDVIFA